MVTFFGSIFGNLGVFLIVRRPVNSNINRPLKADTVEKPENLERENFCQESLISTVLPIYHV